MELRDLMPAVMTILLIGIILGVGIFVLSEVRENVATDYTGNDNLVNISATAPTNTTTLTDATKDDYSLSAVSVVNESGTTIPAGFYSFTDGGVITWNSTIVANNTAYYPTETSTVNITSTYTYDATDSPEAGVGDAMDGVGDFAGWIAVIVVVIAAAVVLGIVLRSFGQGARV